MVFTSILSHYKFPELHIRAEYNISSSLYKRHNIHPPDFEDALLRHLSPAAFVPDPGRQNGHIHVISGKLPKGNSQFHCN